MKRSLSIIVTALLTLCAVSRNVAQSNALPKDVNPDSGNRLSLLNPENASERAKRTYDNAIANFAGVPPKGPSMRLHASAVQNLQMQSPLGLDLLQVAILVTGREHDQPYEWSLHELQALSVSLDPAVIDVIRRNQPVAKLGNKEAAIIQVGREVFRTHKLGSDTYARALRVLGESGLVDSVALMADYARVCATLTAFNQQMPPGFKQFLPLPFTPPDDIHPDSRNRLPLIQSNPANPGVLYSRPMTPEGTGPGQIGRHGGGVKSLQAHIARRDIDLVAVMGQHAREATMLAAFDQHLPKGQSPLCCISTGN